MQKTQIYFLCGLLCDKTVWQPLIRRLPNAYEAHVFDFYGFDDIAAMAESVLQSNNKPFILVGHSMGARVALEVYRLAPHRVLKLVLLDTGIHAVKSGEAEKRYALLQAAQQNGMQYLIQHWLLPMLAPVNRNNTALVQPLTDMVLQADANIFSKQISALINRPDARSALASVSCPVLLGVGEEDEWSPPEQHRDMQQIAQHTQMYMFSGCGHMAPFEQPQQVACVLIDWLQQ